MSTALPPGAFAEALQVKRAAERRRRWILGGVVGAVVLLLGLGGYLVFFSPVFAAKHVHVTGTSLLSAADIERAAAVQIGAPLVRQDLGAIKARVEALAPVKEARVATALPDRIEIVVTERALVYQVPVDGRFDWIDADGVVFHHTTEAAPGVLHASVAETDQRLLADVATVVAHIPGDLKAEVQGLTAEAVDRISLTLTGGRSVVWGSAEESPLKGEVLGALMAVKAKVYDVSAPGQPTTR